VILTFRSGYADEWARVRHTRAPGLLREALGFSYQEYSNLPEPVRLVAGNSDVITESSHGEGWADLLQIEASDLEVIAAYESKFLGEYPAITSRRFGQGRMTWVGTLPDAATTSHLVDWALIERSVQKATALWLDLPPQVAVSSATLADGRTLWTVANHSWDQQTVAAPTGTIDLISGAAIGEMILDAWASRLVATP